MDRVLWGPATIVGDTTIISDVVYFPNASVVTLRATVFGAISSAQIPQLVVKLQSAFNPAGDDWDDIDTLTAATLANKIQAKSWTAETNDIGPYFRAEIEVKTDTGTENSPAITVDG